MRYLILLLLTGCSYTMPYLEPKAEYQFDSWSDWVLQSERPWTPEESEPFLKLETGLEWSYGISCPSWEFNITGPWEQMFIGCWWHYRPSGTIKPFFGAGVMHQIDSRTDDFLGTDQRQWQGHNPFIHVKAGASAYGLNLYLRSGKSIFQGAPFESEAHNPDLYWTNFGISYRFFGRQQ